jgi:hypothetical protein
MAGKSRKPYKRKLGVFELRALAESHRDSPVFVTDDNGQCAVDPWLKDLRMQQAIQVAERILGREIDEAAFQACWNRTAAPKPAEVDQPPDTNTATFGGYRLKRRSALRNRGVPKKRKW